MQRTLRKIKNKASSLVYSKIIQLDHQLVNFMELLGSKSQRQWGYSRLTTKTNSFKHRHSYVRISKIFSSNIITTRSILIHNKSSKQFMKILKKQKIPPGYQIFSFDVVSLFTNVPLEETI